MTKDEQGEVCDVFVPPHLTEESHLRNVLGAPMDLEDSQKHDHFCRQRYQQWEAYTYCPDCDLIKKVRKEEQEIREHLVREYEARLT